MRHTIKESLKALVGIEASPTDAIHLLKEDHRKVEDLFKEFEQTHTKSQKQKLIKQIVTELTVHAALEEKFIYPLLGFEGDKTKEAYEEHHLVKMTLAELDKMSGSEDNARAKVKVLCEVVKHHIKEEEHNLLPSLKHDGNDLDKIGTAMLAEKQKLMNATKSGQKPAAATKATTKSAKSTTHRKTTTAKRTASKTSAGRKKTMATKSTKKATSSAGRSKSTAARSTGKTKTAATRSGGTRSSGSKTTTMRATGSKRKAS